MNRISSLVIIEYYHIKIQFIKQANFNVKVWITMLNVKLDELVPLLLS